MAKYLLSESTAKALHGLIKASKDHKSASVSRTIPADGESVDIPATPPIWTVQWSQTLELYTIRIPEHSLVIDGAEVTPTGITSAGAPYDDDIYTIDDLTASSGEAWLIIAGNSAKVSSLQESGKVNINIATMDEDEDTGAITVNQSLIGELVLGGGGSVPKVYEPEFAAGVLSSVGPGAYLAARTPYFDEEPTVADSAKVSDGVIYLKITHDDTGFSSEVVSSDSTPAATDDTAYIPLYKLDDGAMVLDYRGIIPLQVYE